MNEENYDLLTIGDATVDVFMTPLETETVCEMDKKECKICFSYGDKIPVRNLEFTIGGNAANNAVGSSRLGINAAIVLTLGGDTVGDLIVERLIRERVDTAYVSRQSASSSNYSTIINYSGERTIFTYHAPRSYEFPVQLPQTPWVYLTSMGETFRPFYNHFVDWLKKNPGIKLAFNPGTWQMKAGVEAIGEILSLSQILYVNREEAEKLSNFPDSHGKEKELLTLVSRLGPKICIITDGPEGSLAYDGQRFLKCGIYPQEVTERTGAGDAFGSGMIAALIKGKSLDEALIWGTVNSASVVSFVGAQKGLLKEEEMLEWVERAKEKVKVEEF
jgi:sugar/nucleoside kinase (ribokinase family)